MLGLLLALSGAVGGTASAADATPASTERLQALEVQILARLNATRTAHGVCAFWNPGASATNVHVPVRRPIIAHRPLSSVDEAISGGMASLFIAFTVAPFNGLPV